MNEYVWRPTVHLRGRQSDREWVLEQKWECHRVVMTSAGYEREPDRDEWQGMTKDWGKVREFARKMYEALNDDAWGAIEPELFDEIAAVDKNDLSDDARSLANAIEQAL